MHLTKFEVRNYRSIRQANLTVRRFTVLVGPNNEGKSNILHAMVMGLGVLEGIARGRPVRTRRTGFRFRMPDSEYDWERDFPVDQQEKGGKTSLRYDFVLTDDEREAFLEETGSRISSDLPIRMQLGAGEVSVTVAKKGPGQKVLNRKQREIARFIGSRIEVSYIPAVRQAEESMSAVSRLVESELQEVESSEEYKAAMATIEKIQRPTLERLGLSLSETLREFIPDVAHVQLDLDHERRVMAFRQAVRITVDDGLPTELSMKGDGVQSLAAVALTRHAVSEAGGDREVILAVEEPESHLHPEAVHRLRGVLEEIAEKQQVVITTHSPLLVNRKEPTHNALVTSNRARAATDIAQLREALGVRVADNLKFANRVIVIEGRTDRRILGRIFRDRLPALAKSVASGEVAFLELEGAAKLRYTLNRLRSEVCEAFVILDGDDEGKAQVDHAVAEGLIAESRAFLVSVPGQTEAEVEDLIDKDVYAHELDRVHHIQLPDDFDRRPVRWSDRMGPVMQASGFTPSDALLGRVKNSLAESVERASGDVTRPDVEDHVEALARRLERWLAGWDQET